MTTTIQKGSSDNSALAITLMVLVFVALGFGIAYTKGFFSGTTTVIEKNNTIIEYKTTVESASVPESAK